MFCSPFCVQVDHCAASIGFRTMPIFIRERNSQSYRERKEHFVAKSRALREKNITKFRGTSLHFCCRDKPQIFKRDRKLEWSRFNGANEAVRVKRLAETPVMMIEFFL